MNADNFLLNRVAQPFANRFLCDDQPQELAAVLLPGAWVIDTTYQVFSGAPMTPWDVLWTTLCLPCIAWLVKDLQAASRSTRRGILNPLQLGWSYLRWLCLTLTGLLVALTGCSWAMPALDQFMEAQNSTVAGIANICMVAALYLGSVNRPAGAAVWRAGEAGEAGGAA